MAVGAVAGMLGGLLVAAASPAAGAPGAPYQRPGVTERVSVASDGREAIDFSSPASVSADGRYVVFRSAASNLVPGDTNDTWDLFVHDRESGVTERVSVASDGTEMLPSGPSDVVTDAAITPDGRYVVFTSNAANLVPDDTNDMWDGFVHDRQTGVTERVSVASDGSELKPTWVGSGSGGRLISADGRYVVFAVRDVAVNPDDAHECDAATLILTDCDEGVYVRDREKGSTELLKSGHWVATSMSPDARYVVLFSRGIAFALDPRTVDPSDTNGVEDVYVLDRDTGVMERVSVASDGSDANAASTWSSISADGRYVAFNSSATNLVPGDTNGLPDAFVHDRQTRVTERVSVASDGTEANAEAVNDFASLSISADGRYVAFISTATNLVPGDTNGVTDTFVHDRETGVTERVSVASDGTEANAWAGIWSASISADGRYVAFNSVADNLVPGDTNGVWDVFVRDRGPGTGVGAVEADKVLGEVVVSGWATFSGMTVAAAEDPTDDGVDEVGAEITGASVVYQPEQNTLQLRQRLASLPHLALRYSSSGGGVSRVVVYRFSFEVEGTRYEVRGWREPSADADPPPQGTLPVESQFFLYECAPACTETMRLLGGIGTTGDEVRVSVPLQAVGAAEGVTLTGVEASAVLQGPLGEPDVLDGAALPDAAIPVTRVELGIAPPSTAETDVDFTVLADLTEGRFSGTLDVSSLPAGAYRVWARACVADTCGARSVGVTR